MELTPYVDTLHRDLAAAAALGDDATRQTAERLLLSLDPAVRMTLLQALTDAAAEVSRRLEGAAVVDVRLDGRDARLVVEAGAPATSPAPLPPPAPQPSATAPEPGGEEADDATARVTLRLPESLKTAADQAAAAQNVSLNTWLVGVVQDALGRPTTPNPIRGRGRSSKRLTGWA